MNTETSAPQHPALDDYEAGRADYAATRVDVDRAVEREDYRRGQADARTAAVDAELLALAESGQLTPLDLGPRPGTA